MTATRSGLAWRERTPSPLGGRAVRAREVVTDAGEVVDVRAVRKRSSLQNEIKKIFGGKERGRE